MMIIPLFKDNSNQAADVNNDGLINEIDVRSIILLLGTHSRGIACAFLMQIYGKLTCKTP